MSKILKNRIKIFGFNGAEDNDESIDIPGELGYLKCPIFEIKSNYLFGKKIKQSLDWDAIIF